MSDEVFRLYLAEGSKAYQKTIFDIVKIFAPHFEWAETPSDGAIIAISEKSVGFEVNFAGNAYHVVGEDSSHNDQRRALKVLLYQLFQKHLQAPKSHWGILTGLRPTKVVHRFWDEGQNAEQIKERLVKDFLVDEEKADLLIQVTDLQRPYLSTNTEAERKVSIYVGIPFCPTKCLYCSFPSFTLPKPQLLECYQTNLLREIGAVGGKLREQGFQVETVYVGGGTPTTLSAEQLQRLLEGIWQAFGQDGLKEFTVEAGRPDTITREKLQVLHQWSVDRISINPQTMWEPTLEVIGRKHTVADILEQFNQAKAIGFKAINMDLIIGLPWERAEHFQYTLEQIDKLQPENLTVHTLALKRASRLHLEQQELENDEAAVEEMHNVLQKWLPHTRYQPYYLYRQKQMIAQLENVGYCLPGLESLYNIQMMEERQHIIGIGVGSASKYIHTADWTLDSTFNPKDLLLYNERIEEIIAKKMTKIADLGSSYERN